jgi:hypothetical protein
VDGIDQPFEVGVIVRRSAEGSGGAGPDGEVAQDREGRDGREDREGRDPYDEAIGGRWLGAGRDKLVGLGEDAVRLASTAVAAQVATVAEQVAARLERSAISQAYPGQLALDTVELTFGVTLTAGTGSAINAFVTAEGESSFEVTISLTRRPG